jgi:ADP-ribosylglycohydrolase
MTGRRILGCLKGIAAGDAIGKQTENLSPEEVLHWYPDGIRGFEGAPGIPMPRYAGNRKREWRIGETTDDTERTLAVARAILQNRKIDHTSVGRELLKCRKCIHPGLQSLWEFHEAGDPARIAVRHDGCGAAVRVAPIGIVYRPEPLTELVDAARASSIPTHGGILAIAAAAATAAAVSAAIEGGTPAEIIDLAGRAAAMSDRDRSGAAADFAGTVRTVYRTLKRRRALRAREIAAECFPDTQLTIVPLALALAATATSAREAILLAANVGGDSDSVASIAGGVVGALYPDTLPDEWHRVVEVVNGHDLQSIATSVGRLRH